jgi:hypothetical protein
MVQPQLPLTQAVPLVLPVQLAHTPPDAPHAVPIAPPWHVPPEAAEQHPPLHVWVDEQDAVHRCVPVLQA